MKSASAKAKRQRTPGEKSKRLLAAKSQARKAKGRFATENERSIVNRQGSSGLEKSEGYRSESSASVDGSIVALCSRSDSEIGRAE